MATATIQPQETGRPVDIWAGMELEVIGGTGEFGSGKTLFGLTIDPGPGTLVYDNEGSATPYKGIGFEHVDVARELIKAFPLSQYPEGPTAEQRFLWWLADHRKRIASGKYTVVMVDPMSEIESGLARYVLNNPTKFGYTAQQFAKSSGLYWGSVKDYQKSILDQLRACGIKTFYFTVHMRDKFVGNAPSGKREAKGKETLFELASLYLQFERNLDSQGKRPEVPSAIVLKSRLATTGFEGGKLVTKAILPPNLPEATPDAIREYIRNPANYSKLKAGERVHERQLSEAEKLAMQAQIASDNRATAEAENSRLEMMRQAAAQQAAVAQARPAAPDQSAQRAAEVAQKSRVQAEAAIIRELMPQELPGENDGSLDAAQKLELRDLLTKAGLVTANGITRYLTETLKHYSAENVGQLSKANAAMLIDRLKQLIANREPPFDSPAPSPSGGDRPKPVEPTINPPRESEFSVGKNSKCVPGQLQQIKSLVDELGIPAASLQAFLQQLGHQQFAQLTYDQAENFIRRLRAKASENGFTDGQQPKN